MRETVLIAALLALLVALTACAKMPERPKPSLPERRQFPSLRGGSLLAGQFVEVCGGEDHFGPFGSGAQWVTIPLIGPVKGSIHHVSLVSLYLPTETSSAQTMIVSPPAGSRSAHAIHSMVSIMLPTAGSPSRRRAYRRRGSLVSLMVASFRNSASRSASLVFCTSSQSLILA